MTKLLLQSYRMEYETTDITIDNLCDKYNLSTSDLSGYTKWTKTLEIDEEPEEQHEPEPIVTEPEDIIEEPIVIEPVMLSCDEPIVPEVMLPTPSQATTPALDKYEDGDTDIKDQILSFKKSALNYAVEFMENDVKFAEVKEFKDIVSIVDSIDKSFQKNTESTTTVNVMIQNIMSEFHDDC